MIDSCGSVHYLILTHSLVLVDCNLLYFSLEVWAPGRIYGRLAGQAYRGRGQGEVYVGWWHLKCGIEIIQALMVMAISYPFWHAN